MVLFNSQFNCSSFLDNIDTFLHTMPDCRPPHEVIAHQLLVKCHVLYFPVQFVNYTAALDQQLSGHAVVGSGSRGISQPSEECSQRITDSSLQTVSTGCDAVVEGDVDSQTPNSADIVNSSVHAANIQCDTVSSGAYVAANLANNCTQCTDIVDIVDFGANSNIDTSADVVVSLSASTVADSEALHIVWPHRWYISLCLTVALWLRSHRHEYKYRSGFPFMARRNFTGRSGAFTVTRTST